VSHSIHERESPLVLLERLSRAGATGELICAAEDLEVHVYLQEGRVAWATSSAARFAFGRDLRQRAGIDAQTFKELVEECRRSRRPLGEMLIEWRLASLVDVRESLRLQIRHALESLVALGSAGSLFLERGQRYLTYARALTFALPELLGELATLRDATRGDATAGDATPDALARQLAQLLPDLRWLEVRRGPEVRVVHPEGALPRCSPREVGALAFGTGVDVVAVRAGLGALFGLVCPRDAEIWLAPGPETRLGGVFSAISALFPRPPASRQERGTVPCTHGEGCEACVACLRDALARSTDVLSLTLLRPGGGAHVVAREGVDAPALLALQRARSAILDIEAVTRDATEPDDPEVDALGPAHRSLVIGTADAWYFACRVPDPSARVLWLSAPRASGQGLAWALLTATARQLGRQPCACEGHA
jgi:hypothetical protein